MNQPAKTFSDANFPLSAEGATIAVGTKPGETANRIITVGPLSRAEIIASHLSSITHKITSSRGFTTITGIYNSVTISIIAIGMGSGLIMF
jgi:uridine phosphorylase